MSLIEEYFELNEAEEVSGVWKILQIIFYVSAGCFGLWCGYTMAILRLRFEDKCYLFTLVKLSFSKENIVETINTSWEDDLWCDYCQYSMVSSFIVATIWAAFFLMCGKGGKSLTGLPQPWRIVWPSLIFNFIYFIIALSTSINIQEGTDDFCSRQVFEKKKQSQSLIDNCKPIKYILNKDLYVTSLQLEIVVKTSWACSVSWFILLLISFLRIIFVIDFQMYKVCIFKIGDSVHNKKEAVLRITNYEEPKKIFQEDNMKVSQIDFIEKLEGVDGGKRRKGKTVKKVTHPPIKPTKRIFSQPNSAFYVATDLRMLNREKKLKKVSKFLNKTFQKNMNSISYDVKKINGAVDKPQKLNDSDLSTLGFTPFLSQLDEMDFEELPEEEESLSDTAEKDIPEFCETTTDDTLLNEFDLRRLKKRL